MAHKRQQALFCLLVAWPFAAAAQPSAPSALAATVGDASVTLTWRDPSDTSISGYSVRHAATAMAFASASPPPWRAIPGSGAGTTSHTVSGVTNGIRYHFQLRASNAVGHGPTSQTTIQLAASPAASVSIPDANLRAKLESSLGKSVGATITQLDLANLKGHLQANWAMIADLTGLEHAVNLGELYAVENAIADLAPLAGLTRLTKLSLFGNSISDVSHLRALASLTLLSLSGNSIADVSALGALTSLAELSLSENAIADISRLGALTSLTELALGGNSIADVSALGALTALTELSLHENSITDVSALGHLTRLTRLRLEHNSIADISALGGLTVLTRLSLGHNAITDIASLGALRSLDRLYLDNNVLTDVSSLGGLASLVALDLHGNSISDVSALGTLASLVWLYLHDNSISDISALGTLSSLAVLSLGGNELSDVAVLGDLTSLTQLWLNDNAIADIAPLAALQSLTFLDLRGNALSEESLSVHIPALEARGVRVLFDAPAPPPALVEFTDTGLREAVARALGKEGSEPLMATEVGALRELDAANAGIEDISGIEAAAELQQLWLAGNRVYNLAPLASLASLRSLDLSRNGLADISALSGLSGLEVLLLAGNALRDLAPLAGLANLRELVVVDNALADISPLAALFSLELLELSGNRIGGVDALAGLSSLRRLMLNDNALEDLTPLAGLVALEELHAARNRIQEAPPSELSALRRLRLTDNRIADLAPFLANHGLAEGAVLGVRGNPLSAASIERHLPALRARGVAVLAGVPLPVFPQKSDRSGRQGFVRVLNRSDRGGEVLIEAVDDDGRRFGQVRLAIGARAAAHFNSRDLEDGNPAKGLLGRLAASGNGVWRLELLTTLDIEALAYVRSPDGFLTAMHCALRRENQAESLLRAAVFNPGSNRAQRSSLRLLNPGGEAQRVFVWGVDDDGAGRLATGLSVPAGGALTVEAAALERGRTTAVERGLGNGRGKWRLDVRAPWPVEAVNLLTSPSGHLTDLSTVLVVPTAVDPVWRLPLFPAAGGWRQGFVRVTNLGGRAGVVRIQGTDDGAYRVGPVSVALDAYQTIHLNSDDWEQGNAAKGLSAGVGPPARGDWRLALASDLDLRVTAFVRHGDGFLTSMHDAAPRNAARAHVPFFNPGSNENQRSLLRLINDGDAAATVAITALDDAGQPGGEVTMTVPAGEALTLPADELEIGGAAFAGALGDGDGKWRLTVAADATVTVMSLLRGVSGHLTNVSTTPQSAGC